MRQLKQPPPDSPSWNQHEWVALALAIARIKDSGVGSFDLACRDLYEHLLAGRIESGVRHVASNGSSERRGILQPGFWCGLEVVRSVMPYHPPGHALVRATREGQPFAGGSWYFFVRIADLDKHYPAAVPAVRQPDLAQPPPEPDLVAPLQRRRGPPTKKVWLYIHAEIARRCIDPSGRVQVPENASELAGNILQWLEDRGEDQPSDSAMREAVGHICAVMRTTQK